MKQVEKIALAFIVVIFCFGFLRLKSCKQKTQTVYLDTSTAEQRYKNAEFDRLANTFVNKETKYKETRERLRDTLKIVKLRYLTDTIYQPKIIIEYQDSIITILDTSLANCQRQIEVLTEQIKFNQKLGNTELVKELAKYKHVIWRLYRKKD